MSDINFVSSKAFAPVFNFWLEKSLSYRDCFTFGRPSPARAGDVSTFNHVLDVNLSRKILGITNNNDSAIFMLVVSGMAVLSEKYSGRQHITFHSPLLSEMDDDKIIFEKRVPLLLNIDGDQTFKSLLSTIQRDVRDCYNHQNYPFSKVSNEGGDYFGSNVLIQFDSIHADFGNADDYDLVISLKKKMDSLELSFLFNESAYEFEFIRNVARHFSQLLVNCFATPAVSIRQLGFLSDVEISALLDFGTGRSRDLQSIGLHNLFERQAARTPLSVAVQFGGLMMTYRDINEKANQLAHYLIEYFKVAPGDVIALMTGRSDRTIVALLAILKSRGAFLSIDSSYPLERKKYLLDDAGVKVLLTDSEHLFNIDYFSGEIFAMDVQLPVLETSTDNVNLAHVGGDLCYVLYTSGSTGRPKGVEIEHHSIVNYISWVNSYYFDNTDGYTFALFTSLSFDLTLTCIFSTLLRGDKIVIYPDELEVAAILKDVFDGSSDVNAIKLTPSHVSLLSHLEISNSNIRVAILGGEMLTMEHVKILLRLNSSTRIYNEYGPTETTVGCTVKKIDGGNDITIGKPIDNTKVYVLDQNRNLVPIGVAGEIAIGGVCVARGYRNKHELTSELFCGNPYDKTGRLYFSGDLGIWTSEGELKYVGRKDAQIKINGHRIEPAEIEKILTEHQDVQDAHIFLDKSRDDASLIALITPGPKHTLLRKLLEIEAIESTRNLYELPNGMKVFHNNKSETELVYAEIFNDLTYLKHGMIISPGDVVFDVGANIGMFTLFVGINFPDVSIYSFEPMKPVYDILTRNISLYDVPAKAINIGLSSTDEAAVFTYYPNSTVLSGRYGNLTEEKRAVKSYIKGQVEGKTLTSDEVNEILEERIQSVQMNCTLRTISSVIREHSIDRIDFLKIDVEKSELDVIYGISNEDWNKIKQIVIEVHDVDDNMRIISDILESHGFNMQVDQDEILGSDSIIYNIYARREQEEKYKDQAISKNSLFQKVVSADMLTEDVKSWCRDRLPAFMIPSSFFVLNSLPINRNGKVDSHAVRNLIEHRNAALNKLYVAPTSEIEVALANIFMAILKKERVGLHDDFFEMGGNSLKAVQVVSRIYRDLGLKTDIKSIFTHTTIGELASNIAMTAKDSYTEIRQVGLRSTFSVSYGQKRLWLLSQISDLSIAYNTPSAYLIRGEFNSDIFTKALHLVVDRHESLRTTFKMDDEELLQVIHAPGTMKIHVRMLDFRRATDADHEISLALREDARHIFSLEHGPLLKLSIIRSEDFAYVLSLNMHHIVTDEWSRVVLFREVITVYESYQEGKPVFLDPLKIQYKDYVQWQLDKLKGENANLLKDYWLRQFDGDLPLLDFPADRRRPAVKTYLGGRSSIQLKSELAGRIEGLMAERGVSKFIILLAAVNVLLHKYTAQCDLIVGTPVSGRDHLDLEFQIGFYINTLALRNRISDDDTFDSLLNKVKETTLEAYKHQEYPFDLLVDQIDKRRDASRSPVFDIMVVFRSKEFTLAEIDSIAGLTVEQYPSTLNISKFDLTFVFVERENGIELVIEYNADLFDQIRVDRIALHFETIMNRLLDNREILLSEIEYLSEAECQEITTSFNDTTAHYPRNSTIGELFEEQVTIQPSAIAVFFEDRKITYAALNERANKIAHFLRITYEVKPDDLIGIMMDRSIDMVVGLIAILKAGAGYVPIDPNYPEERIKFMISDAKLSAILLNDDEYIRRFNMQSSNCVLVDNIENRIPAYPVNNLSSVNTHDSLAYNMYTSGSTGVPKGVMVEHRNVIRLVKNPNYVSLDDSTRLLLTGSINFDASTFEIWGTLLNGGELHVMKQEHLMNSTIVKQYINANNISLMWFTSSWFNQLVSEDPSLFSGLSTVIVGGERLSELHIRILRKAFPKLEIVNGYGPTENTTFSTAYHIGSVVGADIPIGRPISNSTVYILDQSNKLVPKGVYGEICVGGDGLSRGYLNNENLTKDRFIKNPFHKNERLYKTGDLGRWLEDGDVQFLSRKDSQVKIRGFRVELKEIEAALLKCRDITEVAVVMKSDSKNEAYLIAYYVTDHHITGAQLRSSLMMTLPEYMIPGSFQRMESMPLTVNGKLDYTKLPAVVDQGLNDEESVILPKTYIQKMLATIWEEILGTSVAGINQNFFELGGHSLKAAQLVARIQKDLNCVIGFRDVFINPTIESLSVTMRKLGYSQYEQIQASGNQDSYDMSHAQQRLWIIDQVEDDNTAYHVAATYELIGDFDQNAMNQSFNELIERHESLRTTFPLIDGKPRQKILNTANISVEFSDWSKEEIDESVIRDRVLCEVMKAFDLEHDALIRPKVIKVGTGRYIFTLTLHHIISDGVSLQILFKELIYFYNAYQSGRHPELTPLRIQYKDYSAWHNRFIMSDHASAQRDFWMQRFADPIPPLNLPADKSRPKTKTYTSDAIEFRLEKPLVLLLRESSQKNGATMFMCLQALVKTLLYVYTEQVDITTGTLTAGREHPDLVDQIGFYVNTLSIRTILKRNDTFEDVLQRVKEDTIAAYDNQLYPFDLILADLAANGVTVNNPFFEVLVTYEKKTREIDAEDLIGLAISKYQLERSVCHFDLDFNFVETGDSVDIYLAYNLDIYKRERIIEITHRFAKIAAAVMNRPDSFIHTLIERNTVESQLMEILRSIDGALLSDANDDNMFELKLSTSSVAELCNQVNSTFGINIFASDINFITSYTQLVSYISRLVPAKQSDVAANRFARPNRKVHEIECRG